MQKKKSSRKIKIGIIGCGAIGSALARMAKRDFAQHAVIASICDRHPEKARKLSRMLGGRVSLLSVSSLIARSDLVIEAASMEISYEVARKALALGKQVLIMSVGGLVTNGRLVASNKGRGKLWVPSGAIAGVDGLLAARESGIRSVTLVTHKPAKALRGAPYFKKRKFPVFKAKKPVRVFRGTAAQAVRAFPQNVNVAAVLGLAGVGVRKTRVELWASEKSKVNCHEVLIEGKGGSIRVQVANRPSAMNPKTSAMAVYSAAATLRKIFSPAQIGT